MVRLTRMLALIALLFTLFVPAPARVYHSTATRHVASYSYRRAPTYYRNGLPKHRSEAAKRTFLHAHGLTRVPPGYQVDHIIPLAQGGADKPYNMRLLTTAEHRRITSAENRQYGWHRQPISRKRTYRK